MTTENTTTTTTPATLTLFGTDNLDGTLVVFGVTQGVAVGAEISILISDVQGNTTTVTAIVGPDGSYEVLATDIGMLLPGKLTATASVDALLVPAEIDLAGMAQSDPILITSSEINGLNQINIVGKAPTMAPNDQLTLVIRDKNGTSIEVTAVVQADKTFSLQGVPTQGLVDGVLVIDVLAQNAGTNISVVNAATVTLATQLPAGADKIVQANEDVPYALTVADFGYDASAGYTMKGIKIASAPALGLLKFNGVPVTMDQFVSVADLNAGKLVYQAAQDANGNGYANFMFKVLDSRAGINEDPVANTITFNVAPGNDAPVLNVGSTVLYTENEAAKVINNLITVTDVDNATLSNATVTISGGFKIGEDVLSFTNAGVATMGNITGSYNTTTGVMSLISSGNSATKAQWETALRAVAYNNTSDNPTTAARTVSYVVNDGTVNGNTVTSTINLMPVNDAPVLNVGSTLAYTENDAAKVINSVITVNDVDSSTLTSATVTISGGFMPGEDVLSFTNTGMGNITGTYSAGVMSLSSAGGTATTAEWQAALRAVAYNNTSDNPSTAARTVSYVVNDGSVNGNTVTSTINLTPVNDAPVLNVGSTLAYTENDAAKVINGLITVNDVDNATLTSATVTISGGFMTGEDVLSFTNSGMGNITGSYNTTSGVMSLSSAGGTATKAQWEAALRAVAYNNTSDAPSTAARTVSYVVNDGTVNGNTVTSTINLTPVNDAPVLNVGSTLAYTENDAAKVINSLITVNDMDNATLTSATVTITGGFMTGQDVLSFTNSGMGNITGSYNTTSGVMSLSSAGGTATKAQWEAALRAVAYNNTSDAPSTAARTVSYVVNDGTVNGNTVNSTINLTPVNDAPVLNVGSTLAYTENDAAKAINGLITVNDVDNATLTSATVTISGGFMTGQDVLSFTNSGMGNITGSYNTSSGVMSLSSAGGTATKAQWEAALRAVAYNNTSDAPSTAARTVSYVVNDGTVNGNTVNSTINVTAVNDAPTGTNATLTVDEDGSRTFTAADFGFADAADNPANALSTVIITALPVAGTLKLNGSLVTQGLPIAVADLGTLVYAPTPNANGNGYATIGFKVKDNGGMANGGVDTSATANTLTINVTAVNDAPVLADTNVSMSAVLQGSGAVPTGAVGVLVSTLVGGVSDIDAGAVKGIAITDVNTAKGTLYYSLNGGTNWTELTDATTSTARLLKADADNRVYFKAAATTAGAVADALTFRAWDTTTGTEGQTANVTPSGGTTAFSQTPDTVSEYVVQPVTINVVSTDDLVAKGEAIPLTGKADPNALVSLNINGAIREVTADALGDWSYNASPVAAVQQVRYIMVRKNLLNGNGGDADGYFGISELSASQGGTNLAAGKTVTTSLGGVSGTTTVLTDGSLSGGVSVLAAGEQWVQIDLGASYAVDSVKAGAVQGINGYGYSNSMGLNGATIYTSLTDMSAMTTTQLNAAAAGTTPTVGSTAISGVVNNGTFSDNKDLFLEGANTITASELVQAVSSQATRVVSMDRIAPVTIVTSAALSADTGTSTTDFVTSVAAQTITGNLSANLATGEQVMVSLDNGLTWTAATATVGTSTWSLPGVTLVGSNTLQAKVVDTAGNGSTPYTHTYAYVPVSNLTLGITQIDDNAGTPSTVLSGGTTNDTTPQLLGTLGGATQGAALATNEVVNVYRTPNLAVATVVQAGTLAGDQILSGNALTYYNNGNGNYGAQAMCTCPPPPPTATWWSSAKAPAGASRCTQAARWLAIWARPVSTAVGRTTCISSGTPPKANG
ncbi:hypothetical protein B9Z47_08305 [Limnohabitans sp. 2KL-1]|uniref:beta strand repeat-containing protein n=1 Tax=Limnohabitans sp. 2KL-1 TaxID=1100699 RepID=UPI000D33C653|nr:hypothetical protein [Limnohabitans sp. 2KL-1]PUE47863.1 hypothetical protein B9Z47_08305 [Limnohabitans sp. 2KL-1]